MEVNEKKIIALIFLLVPISTIIQGLPLFDYINKALYSILIICLLIGILKKMKKKALPLILLVFISYVCAIFITGGSIFYVNDLFYFLLFILLCIYFLSYGRDILSLLLGDYYKFTRIAINIFAFLILFSALFPSSYNIESGPNGTFKAFTSLSNSGFRVVTAALLYLTIAILAMKKNRRSLDIIHFFIALFCGISCGSRTYLILIVILTLIGLTFYTKSKKQLLLCLFSGSVLFVILLVNSSMMDKIDSLKFNETSYYNFWGTITSGRTVFWKADLDAMRNQNVFFKFFGKGFNFVYEVNKIAVGRSIYAHNDFINIYLNFGILGLIEYIFGIVYIFTPLIKSKKTPVILKFLIIVLWGFNAMVNMFYTYICAVISLLLLLGIVEKKYEHEGEIQC